MKLLFLLLLSFLCIGVSYGNGIDCPEGYIKIRREHDDHGQECWQQKSQMTAFLLHLFGSHFLAAWIYLGNKYSLLGFGLLMWLFPISLILFGSWFRYKSSYSRALKICTCISCSIIFLGDYLPLFGFIMNWWRDSEGIPLLSW